MQSGNSRVQGATTQEPATRLMRVVSDPNTPLKTSWPPEKSRPDGALIPYAASAENALEVEAAAVVDEGMIVLMLNENGLILNCNEAATKRLNGTTSQLLWQPVSKFLPHLTGIALMLNGDVNPRLRFLSRIGHLFALRSLGGESFLSRIFLNEVGISGKRNLCLVIFPEASIAQPS